MSPQPAAACQPNPFATRFIRPGSLEYLFAPGRSIAELAAELAANWWRGQIVGPHGCGKSTLLATLLPRCRALGRVEMTYGLHDGQRRLPRHWQHAMIERNANLLVIDGYEQLPRWRRWQIHRICERRAWGLLVTAHRDLRLPTLITIEPQLEMAQRVVRALERDCNSPIGDEQIARQFTAAGGNVREMLFSLFDDYEARRAHVSNSAANRASNATLSL